ncbi:hypothetical protein ABTK63_20265, partial [Acinetobacter baumannii]
ADFYNNYGTMPSTQASAGLATSASINGKYVSRVSYANGLVTATFSSTSPQTANAAINNSVLVYSAAPVSGGGTLKWSCKGGGTGRTNVLNKY